MPADTAALRRKVYVDAACEAWSVGGRQRHPRYAAGRTGLRAEPHGAHRHPPNGISFQGASGERPRTRSGMFLN